MRYRELLALLRQHGWYIERQRGSHIILRHPSRGYSITVAAGGKLAHDIKPGTLNGILRQAGIRE